jgi:hypothetical protein
MGREGRAALSSTQHAAAHHVALCRTIRTRLDRHTARQATRTPGKAIMGTPQEKRTYADRWEEKRRDPTRSEYGTQNREAGGWGGVGHGEKRSPPMRKSSYIKSHWDFGDSFW